MQHRLHLKERQLTSTGYFPLLPPVLGPFSCLDTTHYSYLPKKSRVLVAAVDLLVAAPHFSPRQTSFLGTNLPLSKEGLMLVPAGLVLALPLSLAKLMEIPSSLTRSCQGTIRIFQIFRTLTTFLFVQDDQKCA
jgi:hypothetical protein